LITLPVVFCALGDNALHTAVSSTGLLRCTVISSYITHHCKHPTYKIWFTGTLKSCWLPGNIL